MHSWDVVLIPRSLEGRELGIDSLDRSYLLSTVYVVI